MLAIEFGEKYRSCSSALEWRQSLGPTATQADAYLACERGDWLFWQLDRLPDEIKSGLGETIDALVETIVTRAIKYALEVTADIQGAEFDKWRCWAEKWLSGEDRNSEAAAGAASWAAGVASWAAAAGGAASWAAGAASWAAEAAGAREVVDAAAGAAADKNEERKRQAEEIRRAIPVWPGE